jgi:hypothetical protein
MSVRSALRFVVFLVLLVPLSLAATACGGSSTAPKLATVKAGDMPEGGDWSGVYYSPLYGYLHLVSEGENINGRWRTASGEKWGEMHGSATGNVFRFEWTEKTIGMVGPSAGKNGKGYFKYVIPKEGEAHEIQGQIGPGSDEVGEDWKAVKQMQMTPDLKSVTPDEVEGRGVGGGWDGTGEKPKEGGGESGGDEGESSPPSDEEGGGGL